MIFKTGKARAVIRALHHSVVLKRLPKQTFCAKVNRKKPIIRPSKRWLDYIENLGWSNAQMVE